MLRSFFLIDPHGQPEEDYVVHTTHLGLYLQAFGKIIAAISHDGQRKIVIANINIWPQTVIDHLASFLGGDLVQLVNVQTIINIEHEEVLTR